MVGYGVHGKYEKHIQQLFRKVREMRMAEDIDGNIKSDIEKNRVFKRGPNSPGARWSYTEWKKFVDCATVIFKKDSALTVNVKINNLHVSSLTFIVLNKHIHL